MKKLTGIILEDIKARMILVLFITLTVGIGFLLLYANNQLEQVLNNYLFVQNFDGFAVRLFITVGLFVLVFGLNVFGAYLVSNFHYNSLSRLRQ